MSRLALLVALAIAFSITIFVTDMIAYIQKAVGAFLPGAAVAMPFLPGAAVAMLAGRFWKRATWQGALASVGAGSALGVAIVVVPPFAEWIRATFGGPSIPAVAVSLAGVIVGSLLSKRDTTPDADRVAAVMAARGCQS